MSKQLYKAQEQVIRGRCCLCWRWQTGVALCCSQRLESVNKQHPGFLCIKLIPKSMKHYLATFDVDIRH